MNPSERRQESSGVLLARIAALAAAYAVFARIRLSIHPSGGFATLVWAPTGIALAALLIWGRRLWLGVFLGAAVANVWAGAPIPVALGIATGNTLEALFAITALGLIPGFRRSLDRLARRFPRAVRGGP